MKRVYLRTERERAGLTQAELAAKAEVDQKTISRLELEADSDPSFRTQNNIAKVLKVDPAALSFGPDPKAREAVAP